MCLPAPLAHDEETLEEVVCDPGVVQRDVHRNLGGTLHNSGEKAHNCSRGSLLQIGAKRSRDEQALGGAGEFIRAGFLEPLVAELEPQVVAP